MADEIIGIKFSVDTSELAKAGDAVSDITQLTKKQEAAIKSAFANKVLDDANAALQQHSQLLNTNLQRYKDAAQAVAGMNTRLQNMSAANKQNTKEFETVTSAVAALNNELSDAGNAIKKYGAGAGVLDLMAKGIKGMQAALGSGNQLLGGPEGKNELQKMLNERVDNVMGSNELMLKLQKDFGLSREQIEKDFMASGLVSFVAFEKAKRAELTKTKAERIKLETDVLDQIVAINASIGKLTGAVFSNLTAELEKNKARELAIAGTNAVEREKIEKKFAVKKAELARKQAITDKAFALFNIIITTAEAIAKAGGNPTQIALATINGGIQAAAVAAQPLPEIPQYEKGGIVLAGGRQHNGHLYGRSHSLGGILINAQGGEYIWDIPTVKKHGDIIKAAHQNRLHDLMLSKYVAPLLERANLPAVQPAPVYDDFMLRATINRSTDKADKNARYIADRVSSAVATSLFNQKRYT